jgi:hypothetical protein
VRKKKKVFLREKKAVGIFVPDPKGYDLTNKNDIEACGLDRDSFEKRNREMFNNLTVDSSNENPVATVCMALKIISVKENLLFC